MLVHGGPFANIAHGCNSVRATKLAYEACRCMQLQRLVSELILGAEKFFDIKCRKAGLKPAATVIVATVKCIKIQWWCS